MKLFPTIVTKAKTIEVLDSGTWGGSIQLVNINPYFRFSSPKNLNQY